MYIYTSKYNKDEHSYIYILRIVKRFTQPVQGGCLLLWFWPLPTITTGTGPPRTSTTAGCVLCLSCMVVDNNEKKGRACRTPEEPKRPGHQKRPPAISWTVRPITLHNFRSNRLDSATISGLPTTPQIRVFRSPLYQRSRLRMKLPTIHVTPPRFAS